MIEFGVKQPKKLVVTKKIRTTHDNYIEKDNNKDLIISYTAESDAISKVKKDLKDQKSEEMKKNRKLLNDIIYNSPLLDREYTVYNMSENIYKNLKIGQTFKRSKFMSTTYDKSMSFDQFSKDYQYNKEKYKGELRGNWCCFFVIKLKQRRGLIIENFSVYPEQHEILLPANSTFIVTDIQYGNIYFHDDSLAYYVKYFKMGQRKEWLPPYYNNKIYDISHLDPPSPNKYGVYQYKLLNYVEFPRKISKHKFKIYYCDQL